MQTLSRRQSLVLIGGALLSGCSKPKSNALIVASTSDAGNVLVADIYAQAMRRHGLAAERRSNVESNEAAIAALRSGDVDVVPALRRMTPGLIAAASAPPVSPDVTWLQPSSAREHVCLATSQLAAEKYWLLTLQKCAAIAPQLRLAATNDFVKPGGDLDQLRRIYGGFRFREILACEPGMQYSAVNNERADVANATSTDPNIAQEQLVILGDPKGAWPKFAITPLVRIIALRRYAKLAPALNAASVALNQYALQKMEMQSTAGGIPPDELAESFVRRHLR